MSKNEIQVFTNETFGEIRTVEENGKILFCGSDVAKALGYAKPQDAVTRHCREDGSTFHGVTDSLGREQQAKFINEGNVYRLICNSKLPSAEKFESWVFDEVLPTIRKTGSYNTNHKLEKSLEIKEMNAKVRLSNQYLKLSKVDTLSAEYKNILVSKAAEILTGTQLIPPPKSQQKMYTATEIGVILGVSAQKIGRLSNEYNLKTAEYGEWYHDKSRYSSKEVDSFRYNDKAIAKFKDIIH